MPKAPPDGTYPAPPGLSQRAEELWYATVPRHASSAGRRAMIEEALRSLDRADEARAVVDAEGMTTKTQTTGAVHLHPALKVEREARSLFAKMWAGMNLDYFTSEDARPLY